MAALANPDPNEAAQLYQQKLEKVIGDCRTGAKTCIEKKGQSPNDKVTGMDHQYNAFKMDLHKSVEVIKRRVTSGPTCENAANYCSTCEQLWDFCPKA